MSSSISFTVRPPPTGSSSSSSYRPSPLGEGGRPPARAGPPSRRHFERAAHGDNDDDDSDDDGDFGARRGESSRDRSRNGRNDRQTNGLNGDKPLVIPSLPNRDWRESSRRIPTYRPPEREATDSSTDATTDRIGDGPARSGLRMSVKMEEWSKQEQDDDAKLKSEPSPPPPAPHGDAPGDTFVKREPLTLEEQALQALLVGDPKQESHEERAQREMILSSAANRTIGVMSEDDAYHRDMANLPDESTMEDFEAVPISAFGMAALRGMGYDPKSSDRPKAREVQRRPQLLGLGATPLDPTVMPTHKKSKAEQEREAAKKNKKSYAERTGRGFNVANLLVATPRNGSGSGPPTPSGSGTPSRIESGRSTPLLENGSRRTSPGGSESDASRRRRRDDDDREYDSGRDSKRRDGDRDGERERTRARDRDRDRYRDDDRRDRDRDRDRYRERETEEERARRKARERERERDRNPNGDRGDRGDARRYDDRDRDSRRERDERERDRDRIRDNDRR